MRKSSQAMVLIAMTTLIIFLAGCGLIGDKKLGSGGSLVQSFFKNWESKNYSEMHAQTIFSREQGFFVERILNTPIERRNFKILSENQVGKDWEVEVSMEVTDIKSALASTLINLEHYPEPNSLRRNLLVTPAFLGIQEFMPVKQTWSILNVDGKYFIDICSAGSKKKRHENIMNYILDAGILPPLRDWKAATGIWLAMVMMDLNLPIEDTDRILDASLALKERGEKELLRKVDRLFSPPKN
jgi:hypothetical protein